MMTRSRASLCSLLLLWLFALGAGPARHAVPQPIVVRGAAEIVLRDVADMPLLMPRTAPAHVTTARLVDRDAASSHPATPSTSGAHVAPLAVNEVRATLALQRVAHDERPRWRTHDAAAPPARSPTTR